MVRSKVKVGAEGCVLADGVHVVRNPVVALLRTRGSAGDGQCKGKEHVAESAGKHRLLTNQTPFLGKSLHKSKFFPVGRLKSYGLGLGLGEDCSVDSTFMHFTVFYD